MLIQCRNAIITPQSYGQWISLKLVNQNPSSSGVSVWITAIDLEHRKLYDGNNMDNEVNKGSIISTEIKPGGSYTVWSCGRSSPPPGTEGTVAISNAQSDGNHIMAIYWECSKSGTNRVLKIISDETWFVDMTTPQLYQRKTVCILCALCALWHPNATGRTGWSGCTKCKLFFLLMLM